VIVLGLTGSIGMGKSTTAAMFAARGIPVFDADEAVHRLYSGPLAPAVEAAFPGTAVGGSVDRARLAARVLGDPEALARLEAIVHPAVRRAEQDFLDRVRAEGAALAVLDIPLLFEAGREGDVDAVVVVTADAATQCERVLGRAGMTEDRLRAILARQLPDAEKRSRADVVIDTSLGIESAEAAVDAIIANPPARRR
jgi:dephospho-CoA kinase